MVPSGLVLTVLILGAYRLTRLIGWDDFPLAARLRAAALGEEWPEVGEPTYRRPMLAHLVGCPFCLGWWISLATYGAWLAWPSGTVYAMVPLAISAGVGLIAKNLDP